jgi:phosphoribosylglycinamide formyltransferase 1
VGVLRPRVAVLVSGRGSNLERILLEVETGVLSGRCTVAVVISNRPAARGLAIAEAHGIPTRVVPSAGQSTGAYGRVLTAALKAWRVDYIILAGFMRVLSHDVVAAYKDRIVNIHPADTARYRGAHGYAWAFEHGLGETTITVHLVDEGVDTGRVLARRRVSLVGADSLAEVEARGLRVEHEMYSAVLAELFAGGLTERAQDR